MAAQLSSTEIAVVLRAVSSGTEDPRFPRVKEILETEWRAIARRKFPKLGDDFRDAIQDTWSTVLLPEKLEGVKDPCLIRRWARQVFVNNAYDIVKWRWPDRQQDLHGERRDHDEVLRTCLPDQRPTPEEDASDRERLDAILELIGSNLVARLRALDDLSDKEIAERLGLHSRDAVAGQLKRFRVRLRELLVKLECDDESTDLAPRAGASGATAAGLRRREDGLS
jgi:RNA polymerase sigma factor (sigma-70 family)